MTLRSYVLAVFNGGSSNLSNLFVYNAKPMHFWPHITDKGLLEQDDH